MSARERPTAERGRIERLVGTPGFKVLLGLSVVFAAPLMLLGLAYIPLLILFWAVDASSMRSEGLTASLTTVTLVSGGVLGFVGLVRSYRGAHARGPGGTELTIVFLLAGIAAALAPIAGIAAAFGGQPPAEAVEAVMACLVFVPLAVLIVAALGAIQRITREYAARAGEPFDPLPVLFLSISLGLLVCAAVVANTVATTTTPAFGS